MDLAERKGYRFDFMLSYSQSVSSFCGSFPERLDEVFIKIYSCGSESDFSREVQYARSESELRSLSGVVGLLDCFSRTEGGELTLVLVKEWMKGDLLRETTDRRTRGMRWTEAELWKVAKRLIATLAAAERRGVSHLDVSPLNIFLRPTSREVAISNFKSNAAALSGSPGESIRGEKLFQCGEMQSALSRSELRTSATATNSAVRSLGVTLLWMAKDFSYPWGEDLSIAAEIAGWSYSEGLKTMIEEMVRPAETRPSFHELEEKYCGSVTEERTAPLPRVPRVTDSGAMQCVSLPLCSFCGGRAGFRFPPVSLCCPLCRFIVFCDKSCLVSYVERETFGYARESVFCSSCSSALNFNEVKRAYGGSAAFRFCVVALTERGLLCVSCRRVRASHVVACGHIHCMQCIRVYKRAWWATPEVLCAQCGRVSVGAPEKFRRTDSSLSVLSLCG